MTLNRRDFLGNSAAVLAAAAFGAPLRVKAEKLPLPELLGSYWTFAGGALPHTD